MKISNIPPKGTADWFPEEYRIRKYIFDTWREVCLSYGYEEYLGPLVESSEIWKAKSGDDVGNKELTYITNKDGTLSSLALRPEMTPTVTRMISRRWKEIEKPVRWFSIANFYRNEKPQKGRNREFWQLNADIFGVEGIQSEIEILSLSLDLMEAFNPPEGSYILQVNNRKIIDIFLEEVLKITNNETKKRCIQILDKYKKLSKEELALTLNTMGISDIRSIDTFLSITNIRELGQQFPCFADNIYARDLMKICDTLEDLGYQGKIEFSGSLMRGFDYYDGIIFEMVDTNPNNSRSLFGGGRYNGLADIFGVKEKIPALGFAPGDETMKIFLEEYGLLKELDDSKNNIIFVPLLAEEYFIDIQKIASKLRTEGRIVRVGLSPKKINKALQLAKKMNYKSIILYGEEEQKNNVYVIQDISSAHILEALSFRKKDA